MLSILLATFVVGELEVYKEVQLEWQNSWQEPLRFTTDFDAFVCGIQSEFNVELADRRYKFEICHYPRLSTTRGYNSKLARVEVLPGMTWVEDGVPFCSSMLRKNFAKNMAVGYTSPDNDEHGCVCDQGYAMIGLNADTDPEAHAMNNGHDRWFRLRCGKMNAVDITEDCYWSDKQNVGQAHHFTNEDLSYVIVGMRSLYGPYGTAAIDSWNQDRSFQMLWCKTSTNTDASWGGQVPSSPMSTELSTWTPGGEAWGRVASQNSGKFVCGINALPFLTNIWGTALNGGGISTNTYDREYQLEYCNYPSDVAPAPHVYSFKGYYTPWAHYCHYAGEDARLDGYTNQPTNYGGCQCSPGEVVIGFNTNYYDSWFDRRWQLHCASIPGYTYEPAQCYLSEWTHNFGEEGPWNKRTPGGWAIVGMQSEYHSNRKDRRFQFKLCQLKFVQGGRRLAEPGVAPPALVDGRAAE